MARYGEEPRNQEKLAAIEARRCVQQVVDAEGYVVPLTSPIPRPYAGRKSRRTHARPWHPIPKEPS